MNTVSPKRVAPIGEARDKEILKDAATYVYQERPQGSIHAHVFFPSEKPTPPRPVVVFFHGGFWDKQTPAQFVPHCLHFASRGAVAVAAETRTADQHSTTALEAIEDARDLIRWVRHNAESFNLDPENIVVGGAAGGALLALMTSMPKPKDLPPVDGLGCHAKAMILFSSIVNSSAKGSAKDRFPDAKSAKSNSPMHRIRRKLPPMLMFHGKRDRIAPFTEVDRFCRKMKFWGNQCELIDFEKADHSFFNFNVSHDNFEATIGAADRFLVGLEILEPDDSSEDA